ncbi:MAG TPA: hypothetical protein VKU01_32080 [Bryobacteraceae bacterium]|nr:hypothetical protein [Bryobacteraceae bacterium]
MNATDSVRPTFDRLQNTSLIIGVLGIIGLVAGLFMNATQFFQSYLYAYLFWGGLAIGSLGIMLLHNVVGGNWGVVIRRMYEAGTGTLPIVLIGLIPVLLGMKTLYTWTNPATLGETAHIGFKGAYLSTWFFIVRSLAYIAVWFFWGYRLLGWSSEQDRTGDPDRAIFGRMKAFSAPGLLIFAFTTSWAFIDWVMSIEPKWYSTVFPWLFTIGEMLLTFAFLVAVLILLSHRKPFSDVLNFQHFNDLGNLILTFTMLWAYMMLSQFLIQWSENLPVEIPWWIERFSNGWGYIAFFVGVFHFCVPFFLLLMRFVKRNPKILFWVAIWMIIVRIVDVFWIVIPSFRQPYLSVSWMDLVAFIGIGGIWMAFFLFNMKKRPLLPMHDHRLGFRPLESEA